MTAGSKTGSGLVELGDVVSEDRNFSAEFKLNLPGGEHRRVKYSERKTEDGAIAYFGLVIDLDDNLEGNIFREGSGNSVGAVFTKQKGRSLPFGHTLGDTIVDRLGQETVDAFTAFLQNEGYSFACLLWEDALAMRSTSKPGEDTK